MSNTRKKTDVSRRDFLKQTSAVIGGVALVSLAASTSCTTQPSGKPPDTSKPSTSKPSTSNPTNTHTPLFPPLPADPPLMQIPNCDAYVAQDRKYSPYHIWVFPLHDNLVHVGVTESLHQIAYVVNYHFTVSIGSVLSANREDTFCYLEGAKICTDLITPVSGTIVSVGHFGTDPSPSSTYTEGLAVIQLSNPDELNKLYTPQYYAYLESPSWSGPIPPMY